MCVVSEHTKNQYEQIYFLYSGTDCFLALDQRTNRRNSQIFSIRLTTQHIIYEPSKTNTNELMARLAIGELKDEF